MQSKTRATIHTRIEMLEAEIDMLRRKLDAPDAGPANTTFEGIWQGADISDDDIEPVTHAQRRIAQLKLENESLREELQRTRDTHIPDRERGEP